MDNKFTELIKEWLDTPTEQRDYSVGALYLLKLSGNQIMYRNLIANPKGKAEFIEYQIRRYYNFRVQSLTHAQVEDMQKQVDTIVEKRLSLEEKNPADDFKKGKRADHDTLPEDIQALYVENLSIVQRMREVHLRLRTLSTENASCPDSERYPFLKELIELDKRLHSNWEQYDHFVPDAVAPQTLKVSAKPKAKSNKKKSSK